jgi:hypothetical protein
VAWGGHRLRRVQVSRLRAVRLFLTFRPSCLALLSAMLSVIWMECEVHLLRILSNSLFRFRGHSRIELCRWQVGSDGGALFCDITVRLELDVKLIVLFFH